MYVNPYTKYARMKLTSDEFIRIAIEECPKSFIKYCEILILNNGMIELACPSHQEALLRLTGKSWKEFSVCDFFEELLKESKAVAVWYNLQKVWDLNRFQMRTLKKLEDNNLIVLNCEIYKER